ncbi:MAG: o-succinylbenzoate synthase [Gemmatimonadetes bacterium]|uniref:o-succinylbenzoate synthase n=1 Tax=Candidatus Kutchimonas denitrificans TaxID=3056748 RepID=A0AAE4Z5V9_9BACT|nr:o-succinylbenzoate synthase [Gemmatimonadota bacterium]NIR73603.1 o-succinylbenzoate synthase [Candidatus Kutchimonas denitrificans]NIR99562.1 o-succinylbenzoate synthase [Gemmatimonadota bacterium]NIT65182.1 o-succinylbenzoate synthase [Gemmatimonadota bacterium]NIV23715.1 o-succinylbenzoate synthase [Gemmatimonadota bacterium]
MKIVDLAAARFHLPLRSPADFGGGRLTARDGLLLRMDGPNGARGWGEAAPLPGLHVETLDDVERALAAVRPRLAGHDPQELEELGRALHDVPPTLRFAVEMAWLALTARARGTAPAHLLASSPHASVPLNALAAGADPYEMARTILARPDARSLRVLKLKLGRGRPLEDERRQLEKLASALPPGTSLRLDGNRGYELDEATTLLAGLDRRRVEYLEEPLRDPRLLPRLSERTGLPIALDESLHDDELNGLWAHPCVAAHVLKPTRLGGFAETLRRAERGLRDGKRCVISSCLESGLGLSALAQLAAAIGDAPTAAGLATFQLLADDLCDPPLAATDWQLRTDDWIAQPAPRFRDAV